MRTRMTAVGAMAALGLLLLGRADAGAQGPREGIKVHGHWVIDIRQPDGTLVSHREFENGLYEMGGGTLAGALTGVMTFGRWSIRLNASPAVCQVSNGGSSHCRIVAADDMFYPAGGPGEGYDYFRTLAVRRSSPQTIELKGSATAASTGDIIEVQTFLSVCNWDSQQLLPPQDVPSTVPPADCARAGVDVFSMRGVSGQVFSGTNTAPIRVEAEQVIQVKVTISFS